MAAPRLDPKKIAEIKRLRTQGFSIPEIQKKLGVSTKVISKYGKGVVKKKRKSELQKQHTKRVTVHSDETIAKHFKKDVKDVTPSDRSSYTSYRHRTKNPSQGSFNAALDKLKKTIIRVFPDSDKILKDSRGKTARLDSILDNKIFRKSYGGLVDVAFNSGLNTKVRNKKGAVALNELRASINKIDPKPVTMSDSKYAGRYSRSKDVLIRNKAREFAARSGTSVSNPWNQALSKTWYTNLTPAQRVDARAPLEYKHVFNQYLRDPKGKIYPKHRMVYHHNMPLGHGGAQTANPAHVTVMKGAEHDKLHGSSKMNQLFERLKRRGIAYMVNPYGLEEKAGKSSSGRPSWNPRNWSRVGGGWGRGGGGGGIGIMDLKSGKPNFGPYRRFRILY